MTVINIPFIAEVNNPETDSPIGIFEIHWDGNYTTRAEAISPVAVDYTECGQAQENLMKDNPVAEDLYDFYSKWNKYHLTSVDNFTAEAKAQLESDIQRLLKRHSHSSGRRLSLNEGIDMWIEEFPEKANDYFNELFDTARAAAEEMNNMDTNAAMYELVQGIPEVTDLALQNYNIIGSVLLDWHFCEPNSGNFNDDNLIDYVDKLASDLMDVFRERTDQTEEALKEINGVTLA